MADNIKNSPHQNANPDDMFVEDEAPATPPRRRRKTTDELLNDNPSIVITTEVPADPSSSQTKHNEQLPPDAWKNRRRMAWLSLLAIFAVTIALFFVQDPTRLRELGIAVTWFYVTMGSIVGAYMGFATWANIKGRT